MILYSYIGYITVCAGIADMLFYVRAFSPYFYAHYFSIYLHEIVLGKVFMLPFEFVAVFEEIAAVNGYSLYSTTSLTCHISFSADPY